jgi:hypothetical protein
VVDTTKRLDSLQASKLLKQILRERGTGFSQHARDEMEADDLTESDVANILRCGVVGGGELINGTWRYRVETERIGVVVAFRGEAAEAIVVTVWRKRARGK